MKKIGSLLLIFLLACSTLSNAFATEKEVDRSRVQESSTQTQSNADQENTTKTEESFQQPSEQPDAIVQAPLNNESEELRGLPEELKETAPSPLNSGTVVLRETNTTYATLNEAVAAANVRGGATLEINGDVVENTTSYIVVTSPITVIGVQGAHTLDLGGQSLLLESGSLTLGTGVLDNVLTITSTAATVKATEGTLTIKEGVTLQGSTALGLKNNVSASISGGTFVGRDYAVNLGEGAVISEISGGTFSSAGRTFQLSDAGTRIDLISGGNFFRESDPDSGGSAVFIDNGACIGCIRGGTFEASGKGGSALTLIRESRIDTISGGDFKANYKGSFAANDRVSVVQILGDLAQANNGGVCGINIISGGSFTGGNFALLVHAWSGTAEIKSISGGLFTSEIALQNDKAPRTSAGNNGIVGSISGGTFNGGLRGIFNNGHIGTITGDAKIIGEGDAALYNWKDSNGGGIIDEISGATFSVNGTRSNAIYNANIITTISGGVITSAADDAIYNSWEGTISKISGGIIIGKSSAIYSLGKLDVISGGTFWGKRGTTIFFQSPLTLEPGLETDKGVGRYRSGWGKSNVFSSDNGSLVTYPISPVTKSAYFMGSKAEAVSGIEDTTFYYLVPIERNTVHVWGVNENTPASISGEGDYTQGSTVTINAGDWPGKDFDRWMLWNGNVGAWEECEDGVFLLHTKEKETTFTMPAYGIYVRAMWKDAFWTLDYDANVPDGATGENIILPVKQEGLSTAEVSAEIGAPTGAPISDVGTYSFTCWNTKADGSGDSCADIECMSACASGETLVLYAQWNCVPTPPQLPDPSPGPSFSTPNPIPAPTPAISLPSPDSGGSQSARSSESSSASKESSAPKASNSLKSDDTPAAALGESEVPLEKGSVVYPAWALFNLILCCIGILLILGVGVHFFMCRRKNGEKLEGKACLSKNTEEQGKKRQRSGFILSMIVLLLGIAGVVVFTFTEDVSQVMTLADGWTAVNAMFLLAEIIVVMFVLLRRKQTSGESCKA